MDLIILTTTLKLASVTTVILLLLGVPISFFLAEQKSKFRALVEAVVSLPLVLPPSVLGYYLLVTFSPESSIGHFFKKYLNISFVFTFEGLVLASVIFGLPFMIHPIKSAFLALPASLKEASYTLGRSRLETLWFVLLPNIKPSLLAATVLTFTHALGEFGVVLMVGGNIEGKTRVVSIAIYDEVQALNYSAANLYSLILVAVSFLTLLLLYLKDSNRGRVL